MQGETLTGIVYIDNTVNLRKSKVRRSTLSSGSTAKNGARMRWRATGKALVKIMREEER